MVVFVFVIILVAVFIALFVLTRSVAPKKYPIITMYRVAEEHYQECVSQIRTIVSESLSIYTSYNQEAFVGLLRNVKDKIMVTRKDLDAFDLYLQSFQKIKSAGNYVSTCKSYSDSRRKKLTEIEMFIDDAKPFMEFTLTLKIIIQKSSAVFLSSPESTSVVETLQREIQQLLARVTEYTPAHHTSEQYKRYIEGHLTESNRLISQVLNSIPINSAQADQDYNDFTNQLGNFNDTSTIDLMFDDFSYSSDIFQVSMDDLNRSIQYDD